jgi:hypothetical protein
LIWPSQDQEECEEEADVTVALGRGKKKGEEGEEGKTASYCFYSPKHRNSLSLWA